MTSTHINTQKLVFDVNYAYQIRISVKIVYYIFYSRNVEVPIVFHIIFLISSFHPVVLLFLHANLVLELNNPWFVFEIWKPALCWTYATPASTPCLFIVCHIIICLAWHNKTIRSTIIYCVLAVLFPASELGARTTLRSDSFVYSWTRWKLRISPWFTETLKGSKRAGPVY